jgi:hypothetical protein
MRQRLLSGRSIEGLNDLTAWQEAVGDFIQLGVKNVVITLGAKGAYYATSLEDKGVVAEKNIEVIDTTGAGYVSGHEFPNPSKSRKANEEIPPKGTRGKTQEA